MTPVSRICIVGGGIAGLTLASALDPHRFEVTLLEAQPERSGTGAALGLWPVAQRGLARIGVLDRLGELDTARPVGGGLFTLSGRRLLRAPESGLRLVDRPQLLAALESAVPESASREYREVTDPATLDAGLVIGADGVRSRVRPLVDPRAADRVRTPWITLRGIDETAPTPGTIGEYWGRGRLFGLAPLLGGRSYWFTAHHSSLGPEPIALEAALGEANRVFGHAAPVVTRTIAAARADTLVTRIWTTGPMRRYHRGRYVVIGDAAHAMTPNLGRGACSAIVDALTLADTLNSGRDLRGWQTRRLSATQLARVASGALMHVATRS